MAAISTPRPAALARPEALAALPYALGIALLLWPALYNGFPLIFSDTGTYISQVMERHLGWDRPPFYSLFLYLTGWGRSLWPPVILQALLSVLLISRVRRLVWPRSGAVTDLIVILVLSIATSLPWTAAELIPDIFTPLLVLGLFLLIFDHRLPRLWRLGLTLSLGAIMTMHLTNLPLYLGLCLTILPLRFFSGGRLPWRHIVAAPVLAALALMAVNLIGSGQASLSPFGATFYLARLLANGPARQTLATDCPREPWALCGYRNRIGTSADAFLWQPDSPLYQAGGPKALIGQTKQIIARTIAEHPQAVARQAAVDTLRQLILFKSGDGLRPWRATAGATIRRDFPPDAVAAFASGRQACGKPLLPGWLQWVTLTVESLGIAGTAFILILRLCRRSSPSLLAWLAGMVLLALLGNAILTGSLSGPHDRYQSRVMWLPVLVVLLQAGRWSRPASTTI
jgi:hypothetical protein